ncbi:hypothetical protein PPYR_09103 [Photinus pyralis]|uniref:C2H2-type domain-containing protein n=1 Tax=Photinus pyralis TaxID=7054 RepID=A0A5N4AL95_PHOPY|nr:zinc finger protein 205-like isoform X2 [Photinus pyralis]KAB0798110.1 hypothetical protein PPYR_09103 [Photinus pyralis]
MALYMMDPDLIVIDPDSADGYNLESASIKQEAEKGQIFDLESLDGRKLISKHAIQLGDISEGDSGTHFVKHVMQDDKLSKVWECRICAKEFGHQYTLMRHLPTHTDERKYQCNVCGKAFRQMSTLSQHRAIHSADRPYICEMCHKTFNRVSTLISHRKTHTGLKPHQCHLCNKAFHQKGNLRNHIFTHTNERPYKCEICFKGFNQMSNLMCHKMKAHHRSDKPRHMCQICGRDFEKRISLRNHEQCEHGLESPESSATSFSGAKSSNGVLVEPIKTAAMQHALATDQTPFALLRPLNGIPVLVRVLAAGDKQMLIPATAEDLKRHGQITITPQVDEGVKKEGDPLAQVDDLDDAPSTSKSLGSNVQIKIPVVATVVQRCGQDGSVSMAIESPGPSGDEIGQDHYFLPSTTLDDIHAQFSSHVITPANIQYIDECGNVVPFDEFKEKNQTCGALQYDHSIETMSFPDSESYGDESNAILGILENDEAILNNSKEFSLSNGCDLGLS